MFKPYNALEALQDGDFEKKFQNFFTPLLAVFYRSKDPCLSLVATHQKHRTRIPAIDLQATYPHR